MSCPIHLGVAALTSPFSTPQVFIFVAEDIILRGGSQHLFHPAPAKLQLSTAWISPQEGVRDMQPTAPRGAGAGGGRARAGHQHAGHGSHKRWSESWAVAGPAEESQSAADGGCKARVLPQDPR